MLDETAVHILGGGIGGTVGAVVTCPLEVVKVRLQSSQGSALYSDLTSTGVTLSTTATRRRTTHVIRRILPLSFLCSHRERLPRFSQFSCCTPSAHPKSGRPVCNPSTYHPTPTHFVDAAQSAPRPKYTGFRRSVILRCLADITRTEGFGALFKGLVPTLFGVLPSRGIYFCAYHKGQLFFENHFPTGSSGVYLCAAGCGSIAASSLTNPIWYIKTRLQLDSRPGYPPITVGQVIRNTLHENGLRGFYRGISASYVGSLETALNFVVYENVKAQLLWWDRHRHKQEFVANEVTPRGRINSSVCDDESISPGFSTSDLRGSRGGSKLNTSSDMALCMLASAFSKIVAITLTYPHEVVRTRLREAHGRYRGFVGTLRQVAREEGPIGLYRGMGTHYIRQVPNSCLMIGTYEVVVFLLQSWGLTKKA